MHTNDDLILTAGLYDLNDTGLTLDLLSNLITRIFLQKQTQSRRAVRCRCNIRLANNVLNVSSKLSIIAYFCL